MLASWPIQYRQPARFVLARRVADLGGAPPHHDDRLVPGLLQPAQGHQLDHVPDMQAVGGAVEPDIGRDRAGLHRLAKGLDIGALEDEAPLPGFLQEIAVRHRRRPVCGGVLASQSCSQEIILAPALGGHRNGFGCRLTTYARTAAAGIHSSGGRRSFSLSCDTSDGSGNYTSQVTMDINECRVRESVAVRTVK